MGAVCYPTTLLWQRMYGMCECGLSLFSSCEGCTDVRIVSLLGHTLLYLECSFLRF